MLNAATRAQEDAITAILRCRGILVLHVIATENVGGSVGTSGPLIDRLCFGFQLSDTYVRFIV
jgi:hypothetical protein